MTNMLTHRCRFVEYIPSGISSLAFSKSIEAHQNPQSIKGVKLACVRENGNIEIWNPLNKWSLEKTIIGSPSYAIEFVCWILDTSYPEHPVNRLFTAGLDGIIREWDLSSLKVKYQIPSQGGAIWSMMPCFNGEYLAVGCEDGCVKLFEVVKRNDLVFFDDLDFNLPTLEYNKSLDKIPGRILSLTWDLSCKYIVTGSSDGCIRKMDVKSGRVLNRSTLEKRPKEDTLVWSLLVLNDGTIVSGDSLGKLTFWDSKTWTVQQSLKCHGADILALAADKDGNQVYSTGIDRVILRHKRMNATVPNHHDGSSMNGNNNAMKNNKNKLNNIKVSRWIQTGERRYHSHDVRALAIMEIADQHQLASGGVDAGLIVAGNVKALPKVDLMRMSLFPPQKTIHLSKETQTMCVQFDQSVQLWRLQDLDHMGMSSEYNSNKKVVAKHRLVAEIKPSLTSNIVCSTFSSNGEWLALADVNCIKLFRLCYPDQKSPYKPKIRKVAEFNQELPSAHQLEFTPDNQKLIVAGNDSKIYIMDFMPIDKKAIQFRIPTIFEQHTSPKRSYISRLTVSRDGAWLASGDSDNSIHVYNLDSMKYHTTLPKFNGLHVTFTFNPYTTNELAVACANNGFFIYNVEEKCLTPWSADAFLHIPKSFLERKGTIKGILFFDHQPHLMMIYGLNYFSVLDLKKSLIDQLKVYVEPEQLKAKKLQHKSKKQQQDNENGTTKSDHVKESDEDLKRKKPQFTVHNTAIRCNENYQSVMYIDMDAKNNLVVVERPVLKMLDALPPSYFRKTFGQ